MTTISAHLLYRAALFGAKTASLGQDMQAVAEHRAVVKAIERHDPQAARQAMSSHLEHSHERFSAGWAAPTEAETPKSTA